MEKVKGYLLTIGIGGALILYASFGMDIIKTTPDHSLVFVNHQNKEFISPPCLMQSGYNDRNEIENFAFSQNIDLVKRGDIKNKGYKPFGLCRDRDGFTESTTAGATFLKSIGLIKSNSRWNDDGSWNY